MSAQNQINATRTSRPGVRRNRTLSEVLNDFDKVPEVFRALQERIPNMQVAQTALALSRKRKDIDVSSAPGFEEEIRNLKRLTSDTNVDPKLVVGSIKRMQEKLNQDVSMPDATQPIPAELTQFAKRSANLFGNLPGATNIRRFDPARLEQAVTTAQELVLTHADQITDVYAKFTALTEALDKIPSELKDANFNLFSEQMAFCKNLQEVAFYSTNASETIRQARTEMARHVTDFDLFCKAVITIGYASSMLLRPDQRAEWTRIKNMALDAYSALVSNVSTYKHMVNEEIFNIPQERGHAPLLAFHPGVLDEKFQGLTHKVIKMPMNSIEYRVFADICKRRIACVELPTILARLTDGKDFYLIVAEKPLIQGDRLKHVLAKGLPKQDKISLVSGFLNLIEQLQDATERYAQDDNQGKTILYLDYDDFGLTYTGNLAIRVEAFERLKFHLYTDFSGSTSPAFTVKSKTQRYLSQSFQMTSVGWLICLLFWQDRPNYNFMNKWVRPENCTQDAYETIDYGMLACFDGEMKPISTIEITRLLESFPQDAVPNFFRQTLKIDYDPKVAIQELESKIVMKADDDDYYREGFDFGSIDRQAKTAFSTAVAKFASIRNWDHLRHSLRITLLGEGGVMGPGQTVSMISWMYEKYLQHNFFVEVAGEYFLNPHNGECKACGTSQCEYWGKDQYYVALGRLLVFTLAKKVTFPKPLAFSTCAQILGKTVFADEALVNCTFPAALQKHLNITTCIGEPVYTADKSKRENTDISDVEEPFTFPDTMPLSTILGPLPESLKKHDRVYLNHAISIMASWLHENMTQTSHFASLVHGALTLNYACNGTTKSTKDFLNRWDATTFRTAVSNIYTYVDPVAFLNLLTLDDFRDPCKSWFVEWITDPENNKQRCLFLEVMYGTPSIPFGATEKIEIASSEYTNGIAFHVCAKNIDVPTSSANLPKGDFITFGWEAALKEESSKKFTML